MYVTADMQRQVADEIEATIASAEQRFASDQSATIGLSQGVADLRQSSFSYLP